MRERERIATENYEKARMKEIDQLDVQTHFDHLKFVFNSSIDMLELIRKQSQEAYYQAFEVYKQLTCPKYEELILENSRVLKRLYPSNQPEVFLRLQKYINDKEVARLD